MKYEQLLDYIEDLEDRLAILESKMDSNEEWKSWEEVRKELGWENPYSVVLFTKHPPQQ